MVCVRVLCLERYARYTWLLLNWGIFRKYFYKSRQLSRLLLALFLYFMLSIAFLISSKVKSLSSAVSKSSWNCVLACLWKSVSSFSMSSGAKYSSMCCKVPLISAVNDPSGFHTVDICVLFCLFPAANLYTSFQGLVDDVMLQYSHHELIFPFLIVPAYIVLPSKCCVLRCFLSSSLFPVLWYSAFQTWWHTVTQGRGKWRGNWRVQRVASTLHTTSERGVSSITNADTHTTAASSRLNWRPRRFK